MITSFLDPTINVWHQMNPYTTTDSSGRTREFLIAEDEVAGAAGGPVCPSGGFHVYEITGELEKAPEKVGYWNIDDVGFSGDATGTCTAHVFRIHEREQVMTAAFYNGGVRVIDISGLSGISLGSSQLVGEGMKEIGYYRMPDADSWSAKTPEINRKTGDFYLFGNDIKRGLDIYHFDGEGKKPAKSRGKWMNAQEAKIALANRPAPGAAGTTYICLLGVATAVRQAAGVPAARRWHLDSRRCSSPAGRSERWTRLPPSWGSWPFGARGSWTTTRRAPG